jgi:hypothetical protein
MKNLKSLSVVLIFLAMFVCSATVVFASESASVTQSQDNTGSMILDQSGIQPQNTVPGELGSATILWVNSWQVYWKITPKDPSAYCVFSGEIEIRNASTGAWVQDIPVGDSGYGSLSDSEFVDLAGNTLYTATLTGGGTLSSTFTGTVSWAVTSIRGQ